MLTHILRKPYEMMLSEVIGRPAMKTIGDGDVKYHLGYAHDYTTAEGKKVHLSLAANPSHLEIINPIVEGMCRAKQNRKGDHNRDRTIAVLMHGDASFTGQGIVAETLYLSELRGVPDGRDDSPDHQQPDRVYDESFGWAVHAVSDGRGEGDSGAGVPCERGRSGGGGACGAAGDGVPAAFQGGCDRGPGVLPPAGAQRVG